MSIDTFIYRYIYIYIVSVTAPGLGSSRGAEALEGGGDIDIDK